MYVTDGCPNDGQYTVAKSVSGSCYTGSWHDVPEDHTPDDNNGNMLVVNTPYAGEFYLQSVPDLCTGTTYELSIWLLNLNVIMPAGTCGFETPNDPDLLVQIETPDKAILQTLRTNPIPRTTSPVWQRFSTRFTIPDAGLEKSSAVIRIINNNSGGCGNDFLIDDIQIKQCSECDPAQLFVPDVFSPNQDGINDFFEFFYSGIVAFDLKVYDRWGSVIFASTDPAQKWDGNYQNTPCSEGVYTWSMTYEVSSFSDQPKKLTRNGQVLLMR
ncbi:T9SS type B sorting domain-containing protein [Tellurirhabdus bombi]|uniref:T9SS type B sorting domain-containing protein n=1 Tax=Tellurirhabdus bombi TaxID=2907205 RepID=UPI001F29D20F|nr:gliding motility-associated C-terminal domain-containing protein [Tellurirhabdus bombi]